MQPHQGLDREWKGLAIFEVVRAFKRWCAFADVVPPMANSNRFRWKHVEHQPTQPEYVTLDQRMSILSYIHGPLSDDAQHPPAASLPPPPPSLTSRIKARTTIVVAAAAASQPPVPAPARERRQRASPRRARSGARGGPVAAGGHGLLLAAPDDSAHPLDPRVAWSEGQRRAVNVSSMRSCRSSPGSCAVSRANTGLDSRLASRRNY